MRKLFLGLVLLLPLATRAQVHFDTLSSRPVGPGMIYSRIIAPAVPWSLDVLEIDLRNPYLELETVVGNDRLGGGREATSDMAARRDAPRHRVVGAVNADFFNLGNGTPTNVQVAQGEIVRAEQPGYPAVGFDSLNRVVLARPRVGGVVKAGADSIALDGFNETRGTDELILYNRFRGAATGTNEFGTEALVRPLDPWLVNDTLRAVVEALEAGAGNMAVPDGRAVLSGHGTAGTFLAQQLRVGDTLRIFQRVAPGLPALKEMVGGNPIVVAGGAVAPLDQSAFTVDRHPRTAAGFSADSSKLYLITVDGRQPSSAGMSLYELADFMLRIGVAHGLNLDGGGSTTMVVRGEVVNSPSDSGVERPVGNALLAVSTAPQGDLAGLQITPTNARPFMGRQVQFDVSGADEFFNPVEIEPSRLAYSVDPHLGTISSTGLFIAGSRQDTGYVRVRYDQLVDSVLVIVKTVHRLEIEPREAVTDTVRPITFRVRAFDQDGLEQSMAATSFTWSASNPAVGGLDAAGVFKGRASGSTQVVVSHGSVTDTARVTVQVGQGVQVVDAMDATEGWTLAGEEMDPTGTRLDVVETPVSAGTHAFRIDYRFTEQQGARSRIFLETDLPLYGVPDSIFVDVRSDGANHRVYFDLTDANGAAFQAYVRKFASNETVLDVQPASIYNAVAQSTSPTPTFPVRLRRIHILLDYAGGRTAGKTYEGTLYVDNLRVSYPARATGTAADGPSPSGFTLFPNYPNPFHAWTRVRFAVDRTRPVRLVLYDALGRACATVYEGIAAPGEHTVRLDAEQLPSGLYFLRADDGRAIKMLIVR